MGLEWKHVNFENGTIQVKQASQYVKGLGTITKQPKNESLKRVISIPDSVILLLKQYKASQNEQRFACGDKWVHSDRLFTQWDGKPMYPHTPSVWFNDFIKEKGLPHITFHQLRHTSASLLIGSGVDVLTVSKRLGHAKTSTTLDIYSHVLKGADKIAAEKLESLLVVK